jgi:hypothetical protein
MSLEQINRALRVETGSPTAKATLLMIANRANDDGTGWVPVSEIMRFAELGKRTVLDALKRLVAGNWLKVEKHGGEYRTNRYVLNLPEWKPVREPHPNGAGAAPLGNPKVQGAHQDSAGAAPGIVREPHLSGAGGAPNTSYPSENDLEQSFVACAQKEIPKFLDGVPEAMRPALKTWWWYKKERGQEFKGRGWATVQLAAMKHSPYVVGLTVYRSVMNTWPGAYFWKVEAELRIVGSQQGHESSVEKREKKEGGPGFAVNGVELAGFPWEALHLVERGTAPELPWELQTPRFRSNMRRLWAELPAARREEIEGMASARAADEKTEGAAAA